MKERKKKNWKRPELMVIVRCKPEESVLSGCKTTGSCGEGTTKGPFIASS